MLKVNVTGQTMVFRNDDKGFPIYSTTIGRKNQDGSWDNAPVELKFKKGIELQNRAQINILNGFETFRSYEKDGKKNHVKYYMILEFEQEDAPVEQVEPCGFVGVETDCPF